MEIIEFVSSSTFTTQFTFFFVMSADDASSGRLITSHEGNIVFGYWSTRMGSFWMDEMLLYKDIIQTMETSNF